MRHFVISEDSPKEKYAELYTLAEGDVFKVEGNYETVMRRITDYKEPNRAFEVFPINPGTDKYTLVGPDHCMVVKNQLLTIR